MRLRIRFGKAGKVRWTSHRDVARMWERAFRRTGLPVAYTAGFSPRPRISFGLALPTGHESVAEYLDVDLATVSDLDAGEIVEALSGALPVGVDAIGAAALPVGAASLQEAVTSCSWTIELPGVSIAGAQQLAEAAQSADALVATRTRKGREVVDDLRQALVSADAIQRDGAAAIACELLTQPRGVRPTELLLALDPTLAVGLVCRTNQWIERDGARQEPLDVIAVAAPHAELRAS